MNSDPDSDSEIPDLLPVEANGQPSESTRAVKAKRVPLTIICGFLGAGKSTLLRRILTERHGYRIAVIMNEFGDTADIEAKSITVDGESTTLELANGCLCCSIKDVGAAAIEKLMQKQGAFDHILLETTGLADPGPIAGMFWHNEEYIDAQSIGSENGIVLDGVVCVVDAVFGLKQMEEDHATEGVEGHDASGSKGPGESLRQIAGSDVIILNKVDLVESSTISATEAAIKHVNPIAPIFHTIRAELDLAHILNIEAYSSGKHLNVSHEESHAHDELDHDHEGHNHPSPAVPHYVARGISSLQISLPPLSPSQFAALDIWIRTILWEGRLPGQDSSSQSPSDSNIGVLRCKGLLVLASGEQRVLQGVRSMYEITAVEDNDENTKSEFPHAGKVVLIGKGLGEEVRRSLMSTVVGSD